MREPGRPADEESDVLIAPVDYVPPGHEPPARRHARPRHLGVSAALLAILLFAWFLLGARAVQLQIVPAESALDIEGGFSLRLGDSLLLRPGTYRAHARAAGHHPLEAPFTVTAQSGQELQLQLRKLPGRLRLAVTPPSAQLQVDGTPTPWSPDTPVELEAGRRLLYLEAERHRAREQAIDVEGMGREQALQLTLEPAWGTYHVVTEPAGATLKLDDATLGSTPLDVELLEGARQLRLVLPGYRDETLGITAVAGERRTLEPVVLVRADARVLVSSRPAGASITLDGVFQGRAPLELTLQSGKQHELIAFLSGYERAVHRLATRQGEQQVTLELPSLRGEVQIDVEPADALIFSGSREIARGPTRLSLPATPQTLSVRREGYANREVQVTPRPGFPQQLSVKLSTLEQQRQAAISTRLTSSAGHELVLLKPASFRMGSSRREVGRRANEAIREVRLQRPFYLGVAEVTNAQFRQFRAAHSSGNFKGKSLNADEQPATMVSWTDAALYCNWLSEREGLPPFYRVAGKSVVGADRASRGYRLPSEAEWAWAASVRPGAAPLRFPWGDTLPPPAKAGNYADRSGESLLGTVIVGYDDGFPVAAPVRRFAPDPRGLFDLGGNASEWVHDLYEAAPPGGTESDPLGPDIGEFHVIRGASWRHGGITELRLAYRDYGKDGRADVGFRIARYAE